MTIKRIIHGGLTFQVRKTDICRKINEQLPEKHILKVAAIYIHKHLHHQNCEAMMSELIIPKRAASTIFMKNPLSSVYPGSLDSLIKLYNKFPQNLKSKNPNQFKRYLKKHDVPT